MCLLSTYFIIYRIIIIGAGDQLPVLRLHVGRGVARAPCHHTWVRDLSTKFRVTFYKIWRNLKVHTSAFTLKNLSRQV